MLAQVIVCLGCCCGRVERGKPPVPVAWLTAEWKRRRLRGKIDLTTSGCLGPCDLHNVAALASAHGLIWLGGLTTQDQYAALTDWATEVAAAGRVLPLPTPLRGHVFERFSGPPTPGNSDLIAHPPGTDTPPVANGVEGREKAERQREKGAP
jgi:cobaltochelatase CobN